MANTESLRDARGSVWRRWDPHVHLPGTARNNQFGDMTVAAALDALAQRAPSIEVVGVTDYCTTDLFRAAQQAWEAGHGSGIATLFPNVELRLNVGVHGGGPLNIHLLSDPAHIDELDRVLKQLEFRDGTRTYRCERSELADLGRRSVGSDAPETAAFAEGVNQFKVSVDKLEEVVRNDAWASSHLIIGVAARQHDGTSGLRDSGFETTRARIERMAHVMFTSNARDAAYWLGRGSLSPADVRERYGALKPCLHGSDAHRASQLGAPDGERYCWIKGDATFDALQMARFAPEWRVSIGPESPAARQTTRRLSAVNVAQAPWFRAEKVPLNPGLVAVIGARGSGKTALADVIAAAAGSEEPFLNDRSFVSRANRPLSVAGAVATATWTAGDPSSASLATFEHPGWYVEPVRYLSQQFVDQLCSAEGVTEALLHEIERVVFEALPPDRRQGASSFDELLDIRLSATGAERTALAEAILTTSGEITAQRLLRDELPTLITSQQRLEAELQTKRKSLAELTGSTMRGDPARLLAVTRALEQREVEAQELDRRITALHTLESKVNNIRQFELLEIQRALTLDRQLLRLSDEEWTAFDLVFAGNVDAVLSGAVERARAAVDEVRGKAQDDEVVAPLDDLAIEELPKMPLTILRAEVRRLQQLSGLDQGRAHQLSQLQTQESELQRQLAQLNQRVLDSRGADERIRELVARRRDHYSAYFTALLREEEELRQMYEPLSALLDSGAGNVAKLRLSIMRVVDCAAWAAAGDELLDARRSGLFRGRGALESLAREELLDAWEHGDANDAAAAIERFEQAHRSEIREAARVDQGERHNCQLSARNLGAISISRVGETRRTPATCSTRSVSSRTINGPRFALNCRRSRSLLTFRRWTTSAAVTPSCSLA